MVSMPRCGCQGKPARYSSGRSLRKSSSSRNGSNSAVSPKPKARRRWTPAPSMVGFDETMRLTGRMDMVEPSRNPLAYFNKTLPNQMAVLHAKTRRHKGDTGGSRDTKSSRRDARFAAQFLGDGVVKLP